MKSLGTFLCSILFICFSSCSQKSDGFLIYDGNDVVSIFVDENSDALIRWAAEEFATDIEDLTGKRPEIVFTSKINSAGGIYIGQFQDELIDASTAAPFDMEGDWEKFSILQQENNLFIVGSDVRGTVYGIFEVAECLGVSPWKWWADVRPIKKENLQLHLPEEGITESPSVEYRGIFINDEDWGLQPWAAKTFEPETGDIGPKTYEKVFQLLLRLKANTIWPGMHPCTQGFFTVNGNKEMAQKYHMVIGTSHAEPMLRNNVSEWDHEQGDYNYVINKDQINAYWQSRLDEVKQGNNQTILTLGMRGIHDSGMEGVQSKQEGMELVQDIFANQRQMISNTFQTPIEEIPQVFIPYKEVLDLYDNGMSVPDDVTLMWTDDNYGYIRRLSNEEEQKRAGGSGVYYHLSYWGRPHDYLWLSTAQPGLIWYEMSRAYANGAKKIWIANIGDIKPAEYDMELFLDLAWDIACIKENTINDHHKNWAKREFGNENAEEISEILQEYYRLAFLRKPEYMGWGQTEPTTSNNPTQFTQLNDNELQRRIDAYQKLYERVENIKNTISQEKQDAFFQLVEYPVKGAGLMNFKFLKASQSLLLKDDAEKAKLSEEVQMAYDEIVALTHHYNELNNGKWNAMMSMSPRNLPVFGMPNYPMKDKTKDSVVNENPAAKSSKPIFIQANDFDFSYTPDDYQWKPVENLGYSNAGMTVFPLKNHYFKEDKPYLEYKFHAEKPGDYEIELRSLPTHANNFDFELGVSVDTDSPQYYPLNSKGRSPQWKENVLRNAVKVLHPISIEKEGMHTLKVYVSHTGIVLDQIAINPVGYGEYYEIPLN
ncbi:glycosyl hydrolase 115 family protein [Muricauda sp. CAU 1633]|uniref:glycosyl hydrolase 115 family protein n=1 Tax=Allomuricauda sp. CAU 1633 TaxID=2816036 RepID=UPI001A90C45C|nr:glycosyl hydrolase 115 family protein [Muricauda sp. CAU 1633]MBO0324082.1 glycosyl hydrolase 115 family protein [Muricauda sp. CAU 1633]